MTRRSRLAAAATAIAAVTLAGCGADAATAPTVSVPAPAPRTAPAPAPVDARVTVTRGAAPVPRSYLGLSTEYWALPLLERRMTALERVLALLHVPGDGPFVLRIGGDSADQSFWDPRPRRVPDWAFSVTPPWLARARRLVRADHVRLIIDLNLVTDTPAAAARLAAAAYAELPRGSIAAFEIGNEPDIYDRAYWTRMLAAHPLRGSSAPARLTARTYAETFADDAAGLQRVAPHVPLAGPALANPALDARWLSTLLNVDRARVGLLTVHRYPYSQCARPGSARRPTVARLLSTRASAGMARSLAPDVAIAHDAGVPLRLTEVNSVTCGGTPGVSDTFATALWAPDALLDLVRAGVDGVNVHVRNGTINGAFTIGRGGLDARPLLYGLVLLARTLGPGARLDRVRVRAPRAAGLAAWAVRVRGGALHVLLIDKGRRPVRAVLALAARGPATVQRLLAPSARATAGVTLAGRHLGRDGRWLGRPVASTVRPTARHRYVVAVPRRSAALVTLAAGARRRSAAGRRSARAVPARP